MGPRGNNCIKLSITPPIFDDEMPANGTIQSPNRYLPKSFTKRSKQVELIDLIIRFTNNEFCELGR